MLLGAIRALAPVDTSPPGLAAAPGGTRALAQDAMPNVSRNTILNDTRVPLVVDVDGSLVRGDLLTEGLLRLFAASPAKLLAFPFMLAAGRAPMKRWLARHGGTLPAATLVLNPAVVREMEDARKAGREVWLASGSDEWVVAPLAQDVGATGCFASDGRTNLVGGAKAALLVERFGERGFDYVGNERRDLAVWKRARRAIGVDLSLRLAKQVKTLDRQARLLGGIGGGAVDVLRALRPRQWMATLLVFVPVAAAAEARAEHYLAAAGMAAALAACASSRSLFEDLLNLPADRLDGGRRCRPLAAGRAHLPAMMAVGSVLGAAGLALAFRLSPAAGLTALSYAVLGLFHLLWLRRRPLLGVFSRALLNVFPLPAGLAVAPAQMLSRLAALLGS